MKHNEFAVPSSSDRQIVRKMSALPRIADALDSLREVCVEKLVRSIQGHRCNCLLFPSTSCINVISHVIHKKELFFDVYGLDFVIFEDLEEETLPNHHEDFSPIPIRHENRR